jgi:hypothetical protein
MNQKSVTVEVTTGVKVFNLSLHRITLCARFIVGRWTFKKVHLHDTVNDRLCLYLHCFVVACYLVNQGFYGTFLRIVTIEINYVSLTDFVSRLKRLLEHTIPILILKSFHI